VSLSCFLLPLRKGEGGGAWEVGVDENLVI
jgi:hypothetical protein